MPDPIQEANLRPLQTDGGEALFRATLERYMRQVNNDPDKALEQYGLTLFHSLPTLQRVRLRQGWSMGPVTAVTHYDLGLAAVNQENWESAIERFEKAWEMDNNLTQALYNQALATERSGDTAGAARLFRKYLEVVGDRPALGEEVEQVRQHINELDA